MTACAGRAGGFADEAAAATALIALDAINAVSMTAAYTPDLIPPRPAVENVDDAAVQARGGRNARVAGSDVVAVPVGDDAAGASHDCDERQDVPWVHDGVEHEVRTTSGDQQIAVCVAPRAHESTLAPQALEAAGFPVTPDVLHVGSEQHRV